MSVEISTQSAGRKDDSGKLRWDLLPPDAMDKVIEVYGIGAGKYGDNNYLKGMKWSRVFAAMMRHSWKWWRGETYDQEDGQHHLSSVVWCALTLLTYELRTIGEDDRNKLV